MSQNFNIDLGWPPQIKKGICFDIFRHLQLFVECGWAKRNFVTGQHPGGAESTGRNAFQWSQGVSQVCTSVGKIMNPIYIK